MTRGVCGGGLRRLGAVLVAIVAGLVCAGTAVPARALDIRDDMAFEAVCQGNSAASCYVLAVGKITADTPRAFRAFLEQELDGRNLGAVLHGEIERRFAAH